MKNLSQNILKYALILMLAPALISCGDDDEGANPIDCILTINSSDNFFIDENSSNGTTVGTVNAEFDKNECLDPVSYTITGGNEAGAFDLNANSGLLTVADSELLDYETNPEFVLTINAEAGDEVANQTLTVILRNLRDERYLEITHPDNPGDADPWTTSRPGVRVSYGTDQWHVMDIWEPIVDSETNRPVILLPVEVPLAILQEKKVSGDYPITFLKGDMLRPMFILPG